MTKILIDTNIFLGLYESNEDAVDIFRDIEKIKAKLVIPQQIYDEFLRNRDRILRTLIQNIKNANQKGMHLTALIRHLAEYESLKNAKRELSQINNTLIQKIEEMISDPAKDPIFSRFTKLYKSRSVSKIKKNDALIQKAFLRKLSGNPPISPKQGTIGDEIIWESILEHVNDNLILVTRDGTYKAHSTFLIEEYRKKTGRSLSIFDKMSDALKKVGEAPSDKLVQFEEEQTKEFESAQRLIDALSKKLEFRLYNKHLADTDTFNKYNETNERIDMHIANMYKLYGDLAARDSVNFQIEGKKSGDGDEPLSEDSGEQ
ncbi:PIN domain protein [anaerobic digester metagenome]